jgi:hypothetical protein
MNNLSYISTLTVGTKLKSCDLQLLVHSSKIATVDQSGNTSQPLVTFKPSFFNQSYSIIVPDCY